MASTSMRLSSPAAAFGGRAARPHQPRQRVAQICRAAEPSSKPRALRLPERATDQVTQAAAAIEAAWRGGVKRQRVELLLPLIGATDLDDWPGGIRQQFKAIQPMVESILRTIKQVEGLQGALTPELWDDGDAVACYRSDKMAAVIFPTAATIDRLRKLSEGPGAPDLVIIINPQWESKGNLISDFGIGPWGAAKKQVAESFTTSFWLRQQRVYGDVVRVLYGYPGEWQVIAEMTSGGAREATSIASLPKLPTYQEIEQLLRARPEASINKSVQQRLQEEWEFNRKSLDQKF